MEAKRTLIDAREMAELTRLPISSIWRGCRNGSLPHYRMGRVVRFDVTEVLSSLHKNAMASQGSE